MKKQTALNITIIALAISTFIYASHKNKTDNDVQSTILESTADVMAYHKYAIIKTEEALGENGKSIYPSAINSTNIDLIQEHFFTNSYAQLKDEFSSPDADERWNLLLRGIDFSLLSDMQHQLKKNLGESSPDMDDTVSGIIASRAMIVDDIHTSYRPPMIVQEYIEQTTGFSLGTGIKISEDFLVTLIVENSPADKDGKIKAGDIISSIKIGGKEIELSSENILETIGLINNSNEAVQFEFIRSGKNLKTSITPETYELNPNKVRFIDEVIKLDSGKTVKATRAVISLLYEGKEGKYNISDEILEHLNGKLSKDSTLILDMRISSGGAVSEAARVSNLFVKDGILGKTRDNNNNVREIKLPKNEQSLDWDGTIVVWVSPLTASSSELLIQSIKDQRENVVVVGSKSYGKGVSQQRIALDREASINGAQPRIGELWYSNLELYGPSNRPIQKNGVQLDLKLKQLEDIEFTISEIEPFQIADYPLSESEVYKSNNEYALNNPLEYDALYLEATSYILGK